LKSRSITPGYQVVDHGLNVIEIKQWVRPYLGYYLGLADDDSRGVLEDAPPTASLRQVREEFLEVSEIGFKRLMTLLRQGVEGRLDDVILVGVGSIVAGVSTLHA
jgi:hypothetical protein